MMFNFLFRNLLHIHGRYANLALLNPNKFQDFSCPFFVKYISTNSNEHSFIVSYLINSRGLSSESALKASKIVQFDTPEKPDLMVNIFKSSGFSEIQVSDLIRKSPKLLLCNPGKTLLPKLEFFHSKGVSSRDLAKLLCRRPNVIQRSLKNQIIPSFHYLSNLLQSSEKAITVIKNSSRILETYIGPKIDILRYYGVPEAKISTFLCHWPHSFLSKSDQFKEIVKEVKEMGISPLKIQFVLAIVAKRIMSKSHWERKHDVYKKWGWSDKEFLATFSMYPWCMIASVDKITATVDYFVNKMGWDSFIISKHPLLITMRLEKRLIPRAAVIHFLSLKGLINKKINSLTYMFECPENTFLQKSVNSYDEAP
ncbi:uncharacterized protein LOC116124079 [Pistacia vera]|uniref:uncharacterized protein LOC116124079 n=1 Tax=Pistacia vera TaxID=55513 RepID=UPI0012632205|nr:uncharacterized protein LOC116124079 [Pistacia vera]